VLGSILSSSEHLLLAAVVEVAVRTVTLPNLHYYFSGGARVCWFCSDCCCINTYRRML